jgi:hypothetical protein
MLLGPGAPGAADSASLQALLSELGRGAGRASLPSVRRELQALSDFVTAAAPEGEAPHDIAEENGTRRHFPALGLIVRRYDDYVACAPAPCARPACLRPMRPGRPANDAAHRRGI